MESWDPWDHLGKCTLYFFLEAHFFHNSVPWNPAWKEPCFTLGLWSIPHCVHSEWHVTLKFINLLYFWWTALNINTQNCMTPFKKWSSFEGSCKCSKHVSKSSLGLLWKTAANYFKNLISGKFFSCCFRSGFTSNRKPSVGKFRIYRTPSWRITFQI